MGTVYLIEATPYDPSAGGGSGAEVTHRYSTGTGVGAPTFGGHLWLARVQEKPSFSVEAFSDPVIGGRSRVSIGAIRILREAGDPDLRGLNWYGRSVTVKRGQHSDALGSFTTIVRGRVVSFTWDAEAYTIGVSDLSSALDTPLQDTLYAGTGDDEGGEDLEGEPKPRCFGKPRNIAPVLVDADDLVYQFSDRAAKAVDAVYDQGVELESEGDVSTLGISDIRDWPACGGRYVTDLSKGLMRLGAEPAGTPTMDVQGDHDGGTLIQTAADLVRHIVGEFLTDPDDLDTASFSAANTANSSPCSLYISGTRPSAREVIESLMTSIGGYVAIASGGLLKVGVISVGTSAGTIEQKDIDSVTRYDAPRPFWRRKLGYARAWTVLPQDVIDAAAIASADRKFMQRELRFVSAQDASVKTAHLEAQDGELATLLDGKSAASTEASRQLTLLGTRRDDYAIEILRHAQELEVGETYTFVHEQLRVPAGQDLVVRRLEERPGERTLVQAWG